jgi:ATP-dependent Clp protease ATP-binding subunit ClpA
MTEYITRKEFEERLKTITSESKSTPKVPKVPRKPSEYNKFLGVAMQKIKAENPLLEQSEIMKIAAKTWKESKEIKENDIKE